MADPEEEQYTGAVLDDQPLKGEFEADTLFPSTRYDHDTLSNVHNRKRRERDAEAARQQEEDQRTYLRGQRRRAYLDRVLLFITRYHLLPQKWLFVNAEGGERYPEFVCTIRDNWWHWGKSIGSALSFVISVIWLVVWLMGAPTAVMHDGTNVINLWNPSAPNNYDLSSEKVSAWITEHRTNMTEVRPRDMRAEYFSAHVYPAGERRNITLPWLYDALYHACKHDAKDENDLCACMPAIEIGIMANVILVDSTGKDKGTVLINPSATAVSDKTVGVTYDDGTKASAPYAVMVEYMHRSGKVERSREKLHHAFCIMRALKLVGKPLPE